MLRTGSAARLASATRAGHLQAASAQQQQRAQRLPPPSKVPALGSAGRSVLRSSIPPLEGAEGVSSCSADGMMVVHIFERQPSKAKCDVEPKALGRLSLAFEATTADLLSGISDMVGRRVAPGTVGCSLIGTKITQKNFSMFKCKARTAGKTGSKAHDDIAKSQALEQPVSEYLKPEAVIVVC